MRDWTGSVVRMDALRVGCRYCFAVVGSLCVARADGKPIVAFPAHVCRINDAKRVTS